MSAAPARRSGRLWGALGPRAPSGAVRGPEAAAAAALLAGWRAGGGGERARAGGAGRGRGAGRPD